MNFYEKVYDIVKQIPKGKVLTYGKIAILAGNPKASRAVGYALHRNPDPRTIPCHRVVNKQGKLADSFAFGGCNEHKQRLINEGVIFTDENLVDLDKHLWIIFDI